MKNNKDDFKQTLKEEALKKDIQLNDIQLDRLYVYKELLIEWNSKINLTAITEDYQIILKHFIDCLEIVKYIKNDESIIDIGTGAGFPGVVIAIYYDNKVNITLLDSLNKRILFLEEVVKKLTLKNVKIIHARAEECAHKNEFRERYDLVVSRAVAPLNILLEYDIPYIKVGGRALLLKGNNVLEEIKDSDNALKILNCHLSNIYKYNYQVNEDIYNRNIIEINKFNKCSPKYPRSYGKIKKSPL